MLNGLDLFSGIGGLGIALRPWVRTVAYCENDRYAQAVLLSRMSDGSLEKAPIWDDVRTLRAGHFESPIDIIVGGFPCQDISVAGTGRGLDGERSGLFFEVARLVSELRPRYTFLENVPAITVRGLDRVVGELSELGYDCRWTINSASELGAVHKRKRWFLLATDSNGIDGGNEWKNLVRGNAVLDQRDAKPFDDIREGIHRNVGGMVDGVSDRVDRLRCLGNAVVPVQAREAFRKLCGLET